MNHISIEVSHDSLRVGAVSKVVTGEITWMIEDFAFPEEGWRDFPALILGWWLEEIGKKERRSWDFRFMDGPYAIRVLREAHGTLELGFFSSDTLRHTARVTLEQLKKSLTAAALALVECARVQGIATEDIGDLSRLIEAGR